MLVSEVDRVWVYRNALEPIVVEEVEHQLKHLPAELRAEIQPAVAIANALNRLPALYVTTEEDWNRQQHTAKDYLAPQISSAVRWGVSAVLSDPLKRLRFLELTANQV